MLKVFLLPILVWPLMAGAQDSYLCVADKDTGFLINNGEWESTNFTPYTQHARAMSRMRALANHDDRQRHDDAARALGKEF